MNLAMSERADNRRRQTAQWTPEEVAREQAVSNARIARARALGPETNVKQATALARFANRIAAAADSARRRERS